ncbi:TPA: hypothetical protein ACTYSP_001069 [Citrobacter freundii]
MSGIYDESWSEQFIQRVEALRALDDSSVIHPMFRDKANKIFNQMAERMRSRAREHLGDVDVSNVTFDYAIRYYVNRETGDPILDYLVSRTDPFCDQMKISAEAYGTAAFCCALMMLKNELHIAYAFFSILMRPLVSAYRYNHDARRRGSAGGRPTNPLKNEALELAWAYSELNPGTPLVAVVNYVISRLEAQYVGTPSARTIKRWIQQDRKS